MFSHLRKPNFEHFQQTLFNKTNDYINSVYNNSYYARDKKRAIDFALTRDRENTELLKIIF